MVDSVYRMLTRAALEGALVADSGHPSDLKAAIDGAAAIHAELDKSTAPEEQKFAAVLLVSRKLARPNVGRDEATKAVSSALETVAGWPESAIPKPAAPPATTTTAPAVPPATTPPAAPPATATPTPAAHG